MTKNIEACIAYRDHDDCAGHGRDVAAAARAELAALRAALARAERAEARMDALRGWLVDHECKNDRCPFCRTLDLIAELEKP